MVEKIKVTNKFFLIPVFLVGAFYFVFVQLATETLVVMALDFVKGNLFLWIPVLFFAVVWFAILFLFYYIARLFEEGLRVNMGKVFMFIFYYIIPIVLYLVITKEVAVELSIAVVIIAILVRQGMEWLFLRMYKKVK